VRVRWRPSVRRLILALAMLAANSCSLLGLDDLAIGACAANPNGPSACQALDDRDHIPTQACLHWQCRGDGQPGCELRPQDADADGYADSQVCSSAQAPKQDCDDRDRARFASNPERCDGIDNDCDGVIDEGVLGPDTLPALDAQFDVGALHAPAQAELAPIDQTPARALDAPLLRLSADGTAWLLDPTSAVAAELQYASSNPDADRPCRKIGSSFIGCNMRQLALSRGASYLVGASIADDATCNDGELRLGVAPAAEWPPRLYLGAERADAATNLEFGVDVSVDAVCPSGGMRAPAIASIDTPNATQGLAVWLNEPVSATSDCDDARAVDVRTLGFWVIAGQRPIVRASGAGSSQSIGSARSGDAPALLAFGSGIAAERYLVAYGDAAGGLRLVGIAALPLNPANAEATDPLPLSALDPPLQPERAIAHVVMAASGLQPMATSVRFAAAYRTGCGVESGIELARFDWNGADPPALVGSSQLRDAESAPAALVAGPMLTYIAAGFSATEGGWLISWLEAGSDGATHLRAARVTESGRLLDRPAYEVTHGDIVSVASFDLTDRRGSYLLVNGVTQTIFHGVALCSE
jgi:hypothetical protein